MYSTCQEQYKLNYIDKLGTSSANIHTIFGKKVEKNLEISTFFRIFTL